MVKGPWERPTAGRAGAVALCLALIRCGSGGAAGGSGTDGGGTVGGTGGGGAVTLPPANALNDGTHERFKLIDALGVERGLQGE